MKRKSSSSSYRYIIFEVDPETARDKLQKKLSSQSSNKLSNISVSKLDWSKSREVGHFVACYNRIFLACPDPFRPITIEEALTLADGRVTFLAHLYNRAVGFLIGYVDFHQIEGKLVPFGNIAGIGTIPERRRLGIALLLILASSEYFLKKEVVRLRCEVYEKNNASLELVKSHGFREIGDNVLSSPTPKIPPWYAKLRAKKETGSKKINTKTSN